MIVFPQINPVAFSIGFIKIRWYSLSYFCGTLFIWAFLLFLSKKDKILDKKKCEDIASLFAISMILGGRIGYVLFYGFHHFLNNPLDIFKIWHGGMSFHGAFVFIVITIYIYAKKQKIPFYYILDAVSFVAPIGIFFGRISNFINMELYGRFSNVPWAVLFPEDIAPRHPSQIYEALSEGLLILLIILFVFNALKRRNLYKNGISSFVFIFFYSIIRFIVEYFREPDVQIGYVVKFFTMGQLFSLGMFFFSFFILKDILKQNNNIVAQSKA